MREVNRASFSFWLRLFKNSVEIGIQL